MLLKIAWRNLWRNRRRTLITAASVFFAALLSIFMRSMQEGSYNQMIQNMVGYYTGYVQIHEKGYWDEQIIDNTFAQQEGPTSQALAHKAVQQAVPRLESFALAIAGELSRPCMVMGIDPEMENEFTLLKDKLESGDYLTGKSNEILVAEGLAQKLELGLGDTIVLLGQGYHGSTAAGKYQIKGLLHFGSPDLNNRLVYLDLAEAQVMYGADGRLTSLALQIKDPNQATRVAQELNTDLPDNYEVMDWQTMMPDIIQLIEADRGGGILMLAVLYVIVAFGIFGTVLMMTAERKYEFGVVTAIGMRKSKLAITVFLETLFMSLLGALAAAVVGLPLQIYFNQFPIRIESMAEAYAEFGYEPILPTVIDLGIIFNQALIVLLISIVVSSYSIWRIYRLQPVKAMRI